MSESTIENPTKNTVKLTITVKTNELQPYLEAAAQEISQETEIPGFRAGKATYDAVKRRVGEMKIYETALESIVRHTYIETINSHNIETVGEPKINIEKMAPGNDLVYTVEAALMPKITKMADWKKLTIEARPVEVTDEDTERALKDIQRMQTKEVRETKEHAATKDDKLIINMNMKQAGVPIDGGQAVDNAVYLCEDHYIPGFCDQLVGLKEGDKKTFTLKFPDSHYQKNLAGSNIDFDVTVKEVYRLEHPDLNDKFAASLGQKNMAALRGLIKQNISAEKEREEMIRQERAMLETIAEKSTFEEIPEVLINDEIHKMVHELERTVEDQGGNFDDYLKSIKKTLGELKLELTPEAIKRIKVALIIREVARQEGIQAEEKEVDEELDKMAERYEDKELKKRVYSPQNRDYIEVIMRNRKVIDMLRKAMVK